MEKMSNEKIITKFRKKRIRQYVLIAVMLLMILYIQVDKFKNFVDEIYPIDGFTMMVVLVFDVMFSFYNWRCPACKGYLGRGILVKYCNKCGTKLR